MILNHQYSIDMCREGVLNAPSFRDLACKELRICFTNNHLKSNPSTIFKK